MVASVVFENTPYKSYDYLSDIPLKKGDLVVVSTGSGPSRRFAVVEVVKIKEQSDKATSWVVQKVDTEGFDRRMEAKRKELEEMLA